MFFRKRDLSISWIIVFLGNPGPRYENTRHNAGFLTADAVETKTGVKINKLKYNSLTTTATLGKQRVFLMKPQTYMNLSGGPVRQAMRYYKIPITNVITVSDDVALPLGKLRIRRLGSAGGHNGLKDIIKKCGGESFPRIKIGVGAPPDHETEPGLSGSGSHDHMTWDMADWVLSKLSPAEITEMRKAAAQAADALEIMTNISIEQAMSEYN